MVRLTLRIQEELYDLLKKSAESHDRSVNSEIVNAIRSRIKHDTKNKGLHDLQTEESARSI